MKAEKIYFNPDEVRAIALGLGRVIDDINEMKKNGWENTPWTPEARKIQAEIEKHSRTAAAKLEKFTGISVICHLMKKEMKMNF